MSETYCTRLAENTGRKNDAKKSPSEHHPTTLSGYISLQLRHVSTIGKKTCYAAISPPLEYGELRRTSGWDLFVSFGHPCKFQRVSRHGRVTARHSSIGRQPNFAALNRGRHLYSTGRPSRWALAHISSYIFITCTSISETVNDRSRSPWMINHNIKFIL